MAIWQRKHDKICSCL